MLQNKIKELMAKNESLQMLWAVVRFLSISAMVITILFAMLDIYFWYKVDYQQYRGRKFTKEAWAMAGKNYGSEHRCQMYTDLVTNHLKLGMKLKDVEEMIGISGPIYCLDKKVKCYLEMLGNIYLFGFLRMESCSFSVCFNEKEELIGVERGSYYEKVCSHGSMGCILRNAPCSCYSSHNRHIPCPPNFEKW